ncbi:MAG TPA: glycoside hydrolase family 3 N-terminal domain-containing protein, partial [Chthoniobacteraceae bacterium]|nr:glycoside hydrolase family 3 N-terminal domain-containing protein [Chthoniobacteraceae bacterium]
TIDLSRAELAAHELAVFEQFSTQEKSGGNEVDSMMIGHAFYPALDPSGVPSSLSRRVITELLRGELGFRGLVMTDDLDMGAILEPYGKGESGLEQVIHTAINAGNDVAMICHRVEMVERAHAFLAGAARTELDRALESVAAFKSKLVPPDAFSAEEFRRRDAEVWDLRVATLGAERAAQRSADDGKRSPVEVY